MKPRPRKIDDTEETRKEYNQQEENYGRDWDRQTRHALYDLFCSQYKLYAILTTEEQKEKIRQFILKQNKHWSDHNNSRPLFMHEDRGKILVIDVYAHEEKEQETLEKKLDEERVKYLEAFGNRWSIKQNREWYRELLEQKQ